jgi:hypothetical protein
MSIDMMTPVEASSFSGEIAKRWTSYRLMAIKSRQEGLDIAEKSLLLPENQRLTGEHSPKETPDRDKNQRVNKYQL